MAEWSKAHDWKSCVPPKGTVGSNPTLSAIYKISTLEVLFFVNDEDGEDLDPRNKWVRLQSKDRRSMPVGDYPIAAVNEALAE